MKYIWLGFRDYITDCWHDWLCRRVSNIKGCCVFEFLFVEKEEEHDCNNCWHISQNWKEGTLWHYIRQRKIGHQRRKRW